MFAFDLLLVDGADVRRLFLVERREQLRKILPTDPRSAIHFSDHYEGEGAELFKQAYAMGLEGIVSKRALSPYTPRRHYDEGIRRYGFHGLSYEFITGALRRKQVDLRRELIIIAHLGNGASMCALKAGQSVETTMGFSTLSGLPMGTRCGDLDPGIILYLLAEKKMSIEQVQHMLYESSGLLGVSGLTPSMEDLLKQSSKEEAAEAVEFYCYQSRRQLAGLTATLGGLDRVVFTGGVGANAPLVRAKICADLTYLGIVLDPNRNMGGAELISDETSSVAQHVRHLLTAK
jgi:acetate kinase